MPIILKTEQRSRKTVLFVAGMYALLGLGAVTMIYPFLLMVSGSVKSRLDSAEILSEEKNRAHVQRGSGGAELKVETGKGSVVLRPI